MAEDGIVDVETVEVDGLVRYRLASIEQRQRPAALARDTNSATGATAPVTFSGD
jgi:hypothetical protein